MKKSIVNKIRSPDISEELAPLLNKFLQDKFLKDEFWEKTTKLSFLLRAFAIHGCFSLDDWTLSFSNKLEKSLHDWLNDPEYLIETKAIIQEFARFVHAKRPFKHGLPI